MNKLKFCTNIIFIYNQRWNSLLEFLLLFLIAKRNETKTFLLSFKDTIISLERKSENLRRHRLISIDLEINLTISCRTVRETFAIYVVGYKESCHNSRVDLWPREFRHREYDWFPPHWTIVGGEMEITTFPVYIYIWRGFSRTFHGYTIKSGSSFCEPTVRSSLHLITRWPLH